MTDVLVKALSLVMFILISCAHSAPLPSVTTQETLPGEPKPYGLDLNLQSAQGERALSSYSGRLVLLLISTPHCEACDELKPQIKGLAKRLESESLPVSFVTAFLERPAELDVDEASEQVRWGDPRLAAGETKLGVIDTVPLTWLLSRDGVPLMRYEGAERTVVTQLEEDLRGYLRVEADF
jgi:thiol-disulfide isomerase/thioredoxin